MISRAIILTAALALLPRVTALDAQSSNALADLKTRAESSDFKETSHYDDVMQLFSKARGPTPAPTRGSLRSPLVSCDSLL